MIGIVIDHDIAAIPILAIHIAQIVRSHAKVEAAEEEAVRSTSAQMPHVRRTNPPLKRP
jgi:hypothetical protein